MTGLEFLCVPAGDSRLVVMVFLGTFFSIFQERDLSRVM